MNKRIKILFVLLFVVAGGLAWMYWPKNAPTPEAKPVAAKPAATPTPSKPATVVTVEAPKVLPAPAADAPAASSSSPGTNTGTVKNPLPGTVFSNPTVPANTASGDTTDLGDVYLTNGTPQPLTLGDGTHVSLTGTLRPDGSLQMRFVILPVDASGKPTGLSNFMMTLSKPGESVSIQVKNGMHAVSNIKFTPHIN